MISSQIMAPSRTAPPRRPIAAAGEIRCLDTNERRGHGHRDPCGPAHLPARAAHTPRTVPDAATPQKPETAKEALQRRKRESEEVMTRIENVYSVEDLNSQLERAGGKVGQAAPLPASSEAPLPPITRAIAVSCSLWFWRW